MGFWRDVLRMLARRGEPWESEGHPGRGGVVDATDEGRHAQLGGSTPPVLPRQPEGDDDE